MTKRRNRNRQQRRADRQKERGTQLHLTPKVPKPTVTSKPRRTVRYVPEPEPQPRFVPERAHGVEMHGGPRDTHFNGGYTELFVYGTLRQGHGLANRLSGPRDPAVADGRLYFVHGHGGYPVADFREEGRIVGEIVSVPNRPDGKPSRDLLSVLAMEEGAGYTIREIEVRQTHWGREYPRRVLACCWENDRRGDLIEGGDFSRAVWADDLREEADESEVRFRIGRAPRSRPKARKLGAVKTHRPPPRRTCDCGAWDEGVDTHLATCSEYVVPRDEPDILIVDEDDEWRASDGSCLLCDSFQGHDPACPVNLDQR